ncbi:MAG: Type IV-A pilus assembly ATPase PilB [Candidatus Magasanikbacteria bacterium GW2011_GWC2_37_14]|uniref:Type IV-A pilus assembly ATPase PilB n=1 Tax=Candidatus Magasanikbacteria bacterium GW2011_GWC2_37_14 TaxID=1619046 RepID=A0A0G0ISD2_9BACT|nr:MAG: Type IV-A pilus assembly ATPase PilB [Candidatus Magasanikbacteria bacterium GW2011_GWC2_37_14]
MTGIPNINDLSGSKASQGLSFAGDQSTKKLSKKLGEVNLKEKEQETHQLAAQFGLPYINLEKFPITQEALRKIDEEVVKELQVVCFYSTMEEIRLGVVDPGNEDVQKFLKDLEEKFHVEGSIYVISPKSLERVLKLYNTLPVIKAITKDIEINAEVLESVQVEVTDFRAFQTLLGKRKTSDLLTFILGAALKIDASDVHIEAEADQVVVRMRLDGILHDAAELNNDVYKQLISRIKLVSSLKININDQPQDGRFALKLSEGDVDVRVSTMPTVYGESIVMRILHQSRKGLSLDSLGLKGAAFDRLQTEISRPNGMIITTGPTGSGKTTTMYAIMQILNKPGVKIITLEDPVEYKMEGINQSQVDENRGYTFAKGLRSILRQDPDIAMVGEIRDLETAEIAIQAALTGHLILSTIHTNSGAAAIPRFLAIGAKPFLLAPALNCVIGQRLVRRICTSCQVEEKLTPDILKRIMEYLNKLPEKEKNKVDFNNLHFYKGQGCDKCHGFGYKGRVGIYEIYSIDEEIEKIILSGKISEYAIEDWAIGKGMTTMVQDGLLKALDKETSVEEIFRVID